MADEGVRVERVDEVLGWPLAVVRGEDKPLIEDEVLGRKLGYVRSAKVRDLIASIFNASEVLTVPGQTTPAGGRPGRRYFLTRAQALKVVMRSETDVAGKLQDEIIAVYEAWLDNQRAPSIRPEPWAVLQAAAAAALELRERVDSFEQRLDATHRLAQQAVDMAGSKSLLEAVVDSTAPGRATETPDGAFARRARDGWRSMRSVAHRFGLPREDEGACLVAKITRALGYDQRPELFDVQAVVIGGRQKNDHRLYGPKAIELLERPLRAAYATMVELGYAVTPGGALIARSSKRSKAWVVQRMFDAALEAGAPPAPAEPSADQEPLPFDKAS
ncbi:MAG: hypothetical protein HOW73_47760 [Polyangiaceae bacterium]|nr:hypothetical protein [Polyangiaceae bacterium]